MARTEPFNAHSEDYDEWFTRNRFVYQSELKAIGHLIRVGGEGVEIGVGSGRFAEPLGIRIGVEPSRAMGRMAVSRGIEVHEATAEDLPFGDERFDFVLMVTTICFVDDVHKSFGEARRVLRSGGSFVVGFVDSDSPLGRIYQEHRHGNVFYRDATFYSTAEVLALLRRHGFQEAEVVQTVFGQLADIATAQEFRTGHGQGGFVGIRAVKR